MNEIQYNQFITAIDVMLSRIAIEHNFFCSSIPVSTVTNAIVYNIGPKKGVRPAVTITIYMLNYNVVAVLAMKKDEPLDTRHYSLSQPDFATAIEELVIKLKDTCKQANHC